MREVHVFHAPRNSYIALVVIDLVAMSLMNGTLLAPLTIGIYDLPVSLMRSDDLRTFRAHPSKFERWCRRCGGSTSS